MTTPRRSVAMELPAELRDDPAVRAAAAAIDAILAPIFDVVDGLDTYLDAQTAPAGIVDWLAGVLGVYTYQQPSLEQRRRLVATAHEISRWWGTRRGLAALVRADTGLEPVIIEGFEGPRPWVVVQLTVPPGIEIDHHRLEALVANATPAHVTADVEFV